MADHEPDKTAPADIHDLIAKRWSPRAFDPDKSVSPTDIQKIFTAASWAPSSYNEQPWRFLVGHKGDVTYTKIFDSLIEANQSWAKRAPVFVLSVAKLSFTPKEDATTQGQPNRFGLHDTGAASTVMALQATALGLFAHGMGGFDPDKVRASFNIPEDYEPGAVWAIGYAGSPDLLTAEWQKAAELAPRTRKPLQSFVFSDWDRPAQF